MNTFTKPISDKYPSLIKGSLGEKSIDLIRYFLPEKSSILEFGCGVTTKILLNWYTVYSIEHNQQWLNHKNAYHVSLKKYNEDDFLCPDISGMPFSEKQTAWYDPIILTNILNNIKKYDCIIIDGPNANYGRGGFYSYIHLFNTSVPMLFHDVHRQAELELMKKVSKLLKRDYYILEDDPMTGFIK